MLHLSSYKQVPIFVVLSSYKQAYILMEYKQEIRMLIFPNSISKSIQAYSHDYKLLIANIPVYFQKIIHL